MKFMSAMSPSLTLMVNFGIVTVIWFGGIQAIEGDVTIGQLVAFINYLQTILGPLGIMVMLSNIIAAATASAERINEVLETVPEVADSPQPVSLSACPNCGIHASSLRTSTSATTMARCWKAST
jgi:ATP-binding cassette subfamily B multidrug efflux pump